ncbi:hypothetical protein DM860_012508 [Cuscuta australis]|uniref:Uncharacterized protein n=1 Tax=Cuscuta australis TaxID=267555 RepID=A0A328DC12_9ASTE|nr:hypothetical protein DM860_012508 [Cuscuta australis]
MLEIPATDSSASANIASLKRYAPPNQRNRSLGRRKSGIERLERANSYGSDGEKNQNSILKNMASLDHHGDTGGNGRTYEKHRPSGSTLNVISLNGCSNSEVVQLLNNRWVATMNMYNTLPEGSPERPVMYTRNAMPWRLPHQMSLGAGVGPSAGVQRDFLRELWQAIHSQDSSSK